MFKRLFINKQAYIVFILLYVTNCWGQTTVQTPIFNAPAQIGNGNIQNIYYNSDGSLKISDSDNILYGIEYGDPIDTSRFAVPYQNKAYLEVCPKQGQWDVPFVLYSGGFMFDDYRFTHTSRRITYTPMFPFEMVLINYRDSTYNLAGVRFNVPCQANKPYAFCMSTNNFVVFGDLENENKWYLYDLKLKKLFYYPNVQHKYSGIK
ncbi:MAG: hypothetical protein ACTHJ0_02605 [Flavipsychrobacter sp.]